MQFNAACRSADRHKLLTRSTVIVRSTVRWILRRMRRQRTRFLNHNWWTWTNRRPAASHATPRRHFYIPHTSEYYYVSPLSVDTEHIHIVTIFKLKCSAYKILQRNPHKIRHFTKCSKWDGMERYAIPALLGVRQIIPALFGEGRGYRYFFSTHFKPCISSCHWL